MTEFERAIRDVTAAYRASRGLPPLKEIPAFLLKRAPETPDPFAQRTAAEELKLATRYFDRKPQAFQIIKGGK